MANLFITEFVSLARDQRGIPMPVGELPGRFNQHVVFTTSSTSEPFFGGYVRVVADAKAHFSVGDNPVATASDPYLAPDTPEYFAVRPKHKIAVYDGVS